MENNQVVANGRLKVEQYPANIPENQWIPTDYNHQEALITESVDRRIRAEPNEYGDFDETKNNNGNQQATNSIYNVVQLRMRYENYHSIGTGVIIHHTLNRAVVLTAAHNIIDSDGGYAKSIWIEINKNKSNDYDTLKPYSCCAYHVHPKYIALKQKFGNNVSATGYDIGIIEVLDTENQLKQIEPVRMRLLKSEAGQINNMTVKLVGFPGEEKFRGQLYGMMGDANTEYVKNDIKYKELLTYDIDTTPGQSGSPVFKVLDTEKKENTIFESFAGEIVAIHVSGDKKTKINYGTMLNDEMLLWIYKWICIKTYIKEWTTYMLITWIHNLTYLSNHWKQQLITPIEEYEITGDDIVSCKTGESLADALGIKNKIACARAVKYFTDLKTEQEEQKIQDAIEENSVYDNGKCDKKFKLQFNAEGKYIELDEWVTLQTVLVEVKQWYKEQRGSKSELKDIDFYYLGQLMNDPNKTLAEYNLNTRHHLITVKFSANGGTANCV